MGAAPIPADESDRLAALISCSVLDTAPEPVFDELVVLAARLVGAPTAVINLIDANRQWAKASVNLGHPQEIPREQSFCAHAILRPDEPFIVFDTRADPRFADNPLVAEGLLFYAGFPLVTSDGYALGSLCVADSRPRRPSAVDIDGLRTLAAAAAAQLDMRRKAAQASRIANEFATILDHAPDAFVSVTAENRIIEWSHQAEELFGWRRADAVGRDFPALAIAPEHQQQYAAWFASIAIGDETHVIEHPVPTLGVHRDGSRIEVEASIAVVHNDVELHVNAFLRDVGERNAEQRGRHAEVKALRSLANLQRRPARGADGADLWTELCVSATVQAAGDAALLWLAEPDGTAVCIAAHNRDANVGARLPPAQSSVIQAVLRSGATAFVADLHGDARANRELIEREPGASAVVLPVTVEDAPAGVLTVIYAERRERLTERETGLLTLVVGEAAVAIERANLMDRLRHMADHDELTGAVNRRVLERDLRRELERAGRTDEPLSLAILDVDHFKAFNDAHGHLAGDDLLRDAVAAWRDSLRPTDTLARYGGEEFAIVLPDCSASDGSRLADRLRAVVPFDQTVSIGVAQFNGVEPADEMIRRADVALYAAKAGGRNRTVVAGAADASQVA